MSVQNPNIVWAAPTATDNFNWINVISTALSSPQIALPINGSVSGQINLGTGSVAIPGSPTSATLFPMGYEVRTMASAGLTTLQLRIDYGLWSTGTTAAGLWPVVTITVGTTVNTSTGVVGGASTTAGASTLNSSSALTGSAPTSARPLFMSSDGANYLTVVVDPARSLAAPATVVGCVVLERTLTASSGAYNNNGYQLLGLTSAIISNVANGSGTWSVNLSTNLCTYSSSFGVTFPGSLFTSSGTGSAATVAPVSVMMPQPQGPMMGAIGYFNGDVAAGVQFPAQIYGASHNYLACGVTYQSFAQSPAAGGAVTAFGAQRLAMRYE